MREGKTPGLTQRQRAALAWLRDNPQTRARWMTKKRGATGSPDEWTHFEISGPEGSIRLTAESWKALDAYTKFAGLGSNRMWVPNEAGIAALAEKDSQA